MIKHWRIRLYALVLVGLLGNLWPARVWGQSTPPPEPTDTVTLADAGYGDLILRGRSVSAEFFVPGPGEWLLQPVGHYIDFVFDTSDLVGPFSTLNLVWNGLPLGDRAVGESVERQAWRVPIPLDRIAPGQNRFVVQAELNATGKVASEDNCSWDQPLHLTVLRSTFVRYEISANQLTPAPVTPNLARYPWPFFETDPIIRADVMVLLPPAPTRAEYEAAAGVTAQLGQYAGTRPLTMLSTADQGALTPALRYANIIMVGKFSSLPSLRTLPSPPVTISAEGAFSAPGGPIEHPDTGVLFEMRSPLNPARMILAVTGPTDIAVAKAGQALSSRLGSRLLGGPYAFVSEVSPGTAESEGTTAETTLASLGRRDDPVFGIGDHSLSFKLDLSGALPGRTGIPLDVIVSHSPLLDMDRSSVRITLNSIPVGASLFKDLPPARGRIRVDLPLGSLRSGQNTVDVQFTLQVPPLVLRRDCGPIPMEQAWAVLHGDTNYRLPDSLGAATNITLANYPYPFLDRVGLNNTTFVFPPDVEGLGPLFQLLADIGRTARGQMLSPQMVPTNLFGEANRNRDMVVWGTPQQNPVIGQLGPSLPLALDEGTRTRFAFSDELRLFIRDETELGVIEIAPSPWARGRHVLVVSGTDQAALGLSVRALSQPNLTGNLALVHRGLPPRAAASTDAAAPPRNRFQVSTYNMRAPEVATGSSRRGPPPLAVLFAGLAAAVALGAALMLAYQAFIAQPRQRR